MGCGLENSAGNGQGGTG
ncbi:hypothetical protein YPPY66_2016, partial [Yersinia pestis PY-66]